MLTALGTGKIYYSIILILKIVYAVIIYYNCDFKNKKTRNILTFLSYLFPIIIGIICIIKYKKSTKNNIIVITTLILTIVCSTIISYATSTNYYDKNGTTHTNSSDIVFVDTKGNEYTFDYDKSAYDYLYINNTDEKLDADLCYLDSEGYIHYDDDVSITAKDETCCVDTDGSLYYPAKYTTFNKDGTIKYVYDSGNFVYDRLGNAYTHNYIPYYDTQGNKYFYSFDSSTQKGSYTNISTGESFENEYSFVDENGYFVYDEEHSFIKQEDVNNVKEYTDSSGNTYYWASDISWNANGDLLDANGEIIK